MIYEDLYSLGTCEFYQITPDQIFIPIEPNEKEIEFLIATGFIAPKGQEVLYSIPPIIRPKYDFHILFYNSPAKQMTIPVWQANMEYIGPDEGHDTSAIFVQRRFPE